MSSAPNQFDEQRFAAIRQLIDRQSNQTQGPALISMHPQCDRIASATLPTTPWEDLMFDDLSAIERQAGIKQSSVADRTPIAYWFRRHAVAWHEEWRQLLSDLPDFWRVLMELSASAIESFSKLLGVEMIARLTAGKNKTQVNDLLSPLEEDTRKEVFARSQAIDPDVLPLSVTAPWEQLYRKGMKRRIGQKLVRWFAMSLLASLMQVRLPASRRAMATRHGKSDLFAVLNRPSRSLVPVMHAGRVESLMLELLGQLQPRSGSPPD